MALLEQLDEEVSGHLVEVGGTPIHYHDLGDGEPIVLIQGWGPQPGTTAWQIYHKVLPMLAERYRCIVVDLPNYGLTGPIVYHEPVHDVFARTTFALMDHLEIDRASLIGCSVGATTALDMTLIKPERVKRLVIGACHASTGGDPYLLGPFPSEVMRLYPEAQSDPIDPDRVRRLLLALIYESALVTDELVEQVVRARAAHADHYDAGRQSVSVAHSNISALHNIAAPTLIIHGRFDRMVPLEQGLMILSYVPQSDLVVLNRCGHWPPFERPNEYGSYVRRFLDGAHIDA